MGPLFVSLLATAASSIFATAFLLGFSLFTMIFEFWWIQIVYKISPSLKLEEDLRYSKMVESPVSKKFSLNPLPSLRQLQVDYVDFVQSPVFLSSLAISLLYLTVLSFDGTLLAYLISHGWSAAVLAGIRGANVVMGLLGTVVMPFLEKRVGLIRTGSWSIMYVFFHNFLF